MNACIHKQIYYKVLWRKMMAKDFVIGTELLQKKK